MPNVMVARIFQYMIDNYDGLIRSALKGAVPTAR